MVPLRILLYLSSLSTILLMSLFQIFQYFLFPIDIIELKIIFFYNYKLSNSLLLKFFFYT